MFRASLPALAILAAACHLAACQGVPPTVRAKILVPSSLDAACLRAWAVPVYGEPKESPPIARDGRDSFEVAIFQSAELGDSISVLAQAFRSTCDDPSPLEERSSPPVAFAPGGKALVTVSFQALVFDQAPASAVAGVTLPELRVLAVDGSNGPDPSFGGQVTVSVAGGDTTLLGTAAVAAAAGSATFSDLRFDRAATGVTLRASAPGLPPITTPAFDVAAATPDASQSTLSVSKAVVSANGLDATEVTVRVRDASGSPIPGAGVSLSATGGANAFSPSASGTSSGSGTFTASWSSTQVGVKTLTAAVGPINLQAVVTFAPPACGTLRFTPAANQPAGNDPLKVIVTDLTADGRPDVVATNLLSGDLTVSVNRGGASFRTANYSLGAGTTSNPVGLAAGDLDGDPWMDLAVTGQGASLVWLLHGNGDGGFSRSNLPVSNQPSGVGLVDLNHDKALDLVVTQRTGSSASVYLNQRDGGWALGPGSPVPIGAGTNPGMLDIGDLDGDGVPDVATVSSATDSVIVLRGERTGRLTVLRTLAMAAGSGPGDVKVADLRDAGRRDLVVTQNQVSNVVVLLGAGDGTFTPAPGSPFATGLIPGTVAVGDLNSDRIPDLATANFSGGAAGTVSVLIGNGDGTFRPQVATDAGRGPSGIALGDLDGDLRLDVAVENQIDGTWTPLINQCF